jgi:hypothetical protein
MSGIIHIEIGMSRAKPASITSTCIEALQMVVDTRLAIADSGGVLEQYVEDGCLSITQ